MITLPELVKLIPRMVIAVVLVFVIFQMYFLVFPKETVTQAEEDFQRVVDGIRGLGKGSIAIPLFNVNYDEKYYYRFYDKSDNDLPVKCKKENCLCLRKEGDKGHLDCRSLGDVKVDGEKTIEIEKGKNIDIFLERNENKITIKKQE